jgi:hypothetical protein
MSKKQVQILVADEPHIVTVRPRLNGRWIARGEYRGKSLTIEDQTESGAMQRWRATAEAAAVLTPSDADP